MFWICVARVCAARMQRWKMSTCNRQMINANVLQMFARGITSKRTKKGNMSTKPSKHQGSNLIPLSYRPSSALNWEGERKPRARN